LLKVLLGVFSFIVLAVVDCHPNHAYNNRKKVTKNIVIKDLIKGTKRKSVELTSFKGHTSINTLKGF